MLAASIRALQWPIRAELAVADEGARLDKVEIKSAAIEAAARSVELRVYIEVAPTPSLSSSASSSLDRCSVRVTIANGTSSGEHRFQIVRVAVGGHQELPEHLILFSPHLDDDGMGRCVRAGTQCRGGREGMH